MGGTPNWRRYPRLNWDGLSYPTRWPTPVMSFGRFVGSSLATCSRMIFWNWTGLIAVTAWKFQWKGGEIIRDPLFAPGGVRGIART
jgi:hypothetical protein